MSATTFINAMLILPDRVEPSTLTMSKGKIVSTGKPEAGATIDLKGKYLAPGFIDIHVHGGGGADFMDLTPEAFHAVRRTHARHGTTALTPTSTVAEQADYKKFLTLCRELRHVNDGGARIVGAHLYGPYFFPAARGAHPRLEFLTPAADHVEGLRGFGPDFPCTVTIAPELPHAEDLTRACVAKGLKVNVGHSHATFEQVEAAVTWGATHVDHLFCAMSDRAKLRLTQSFPMRGGVLEAALTFDQLTTEVIADGHHLADSLLRMAFKLKGPDKLALVTDAMRAVDCPDGEYWVGPSGRGERVRRQGNVGVTLDGQNLASSVMGLDHMVRTLARAVKAPLCEIIRCATLTPARILGLDAEIGSLEAGKWADLVVLGEHLDVQAVYVAGERVL